MTMVAEQCLEPKGDPVDAGNIASYFRELGRMEVEGACCFLIAAEKVKELFPDGHDGMRERLPRVDYEYRIYEDMMTGNYLVVRPDSKTGYPSFYSIIGKPDPAWKRVL